MKKCAVCEAEIASSLEEFRDPREPVCARCWLSGKSPEFEEDVNKDKKRIDRLKEIIAEYEDEIWEFRKLIGEAEDELRELIKKNNHQLKEKEMVL